MDQAMGDLQNQLDEARNKISEERVKREEAESQLQLARREIEQLKEAAGKTTKEESNKRPRTEA